MTISLSKAAADRARTFLAKRGHGAGLRLGVRRSGCSGFAYVIEYADQIEAEDHVFEEQGVRLVVSDKNLPYLDGSELDFVREGLNEGFKFRNPNVREECGCGESFGV